LAEPEAPPALPEVLRPYQRRGVEWLAHLCDVGCHGLLADEMGLGKTLQVITLLASRPVPDKPCLIVCPASVVPVWREEIAKFEPNLVVDVLKTGNDFLTRPGPVIWLASYTQLRKHREMLPGFNFGYAVLDEGQFIKNPDAKVTQTCFAVKAQHRIVLTGTPLENRQLDLWSIFRFLLPGLLGSRSTFENALNSDRAGTLVRLRAQLAPFILRRTKKEVATELPQKVEMDLLCPLTDVQRAEYARICSEGLERLGDDVGAAMREKSFGFLALLTRLRQTCCDPDMLPWLKAPLTDSGKINLLVEKLAEVVGSGHKVVIFSQFVMLLDRVREALMLHFPDLPRYELTGMTLDRLKPVQQFQTASGAAAMLVSLKAAGTGITLHAADYVFLLDPWWNPAVEAQAVDRVHRIGQTSTVFVYRMVTAGTIEERIQALKADKKDLFDKLIGGLGGDFDLSQHFTSLRGLVQLTTQVEQEPSAYTID
jgi:SNF2 family DNA or RNA helicase